MNRLPILCISFILFQSCQEYYTDGEISNGEELIVIEALITNEPGPYRVKITKTMPYNLPGDQNPNPEPVRNVNVTITDNDGQTEQLVENGSGEYFTSPGGLLGEPGKIYVLHIVTPDGSIYQSEPCKMADPPFLDSVYAETGIYTKLEKNESGIYIEKNYPGINLYMNAGPASDHEYYYRVETAVIKEVRHLEWRAGRPHPPGLFPFPTPVYCWELPTANNDKELFSNSLPQPKPIIRRNIGFVTSDVFSLTDEIRDPSYLIGAITSTRLYSLTKHMYDIYLQLQSQTNPDNDIFDPIPTRVESNITCVTEPSRTVLGYFNVAAVSGKNLFFSWSDVTVKTINPGNLLNLPSSLNCQDDVPPDFWVIP